MCSKVTIFTLFAVVFVGCCASDENCASTSTNGKITLHPLDDNSVGFDVLCNQEIDGGGWTVVLNRNDGDVDFSNRTWAEYKTGFGSLDDEFFIGLDKLNALTASSRHELEFVMVDFENETHIANYAQVKVLDSSMRFVIAALGNYTGDAGDDFTVDEFCSKDRYCEGRVPGWNKDKSDSESSFIFAEHPYIVNGNRKPKEHKAKKEGKSKSDEKVKEDMAKDKSKNKSKEDAKIVVEDDDDDDDEEEREVAMARSAAVKGASGKRDATPVMCWRKELGGECEPLRELMMLVRPVNAYLHVAP